jgi:hypothetical protein
MAHLFTSARVANGRVQSRGSGPHSLTSKFRLRMGKGAVIEVTAKSDLCHSGKHRPEKELRTGDAGIFKALRNQLISAPVGLNFGER